MTQPGLIKRRRKDDNARMMELQREFTVSNKLGIHARTAAQIVKVASEFESEILLVKDNTVVNGKSILDVMSLECPMGAKVRIISRGEDAEKAMAAMAGLFRNRFGEA